MPTIKEPDQVIGTPAKVLSQSEVLSTASSIIRAYPSFTSAYLFGSYAKGTARPDSDIDIAVFLPEFNWSKLQDIGGAHMDLEKALGKKVDLAVCPSNDFVERIKTYWMPIVQSKTVSFSLYLVDVLMAYIGGMMVNRRRQTTPLM